MNELKLVLFFFLGLSGVFAQEICEELTHDLEHIFENSELSGFGVSIVTSEGVFYKNAFGYENIKTKTEFRSDQRFSIASISKTFIGIALMKLVESGQVELSTAINDILPFKVENPSFPRLDITIEHLARHTSGISDADVELHSCYLEDEFLLKKTDIGKLAFRHFKYWEHNSEMDLGEFLYNCLDSSGEWYEKNRFLDNKPGEQYEYSNLGASLAAYIIQIITGVEYREYIQTFVSDEFGFGEDVWKKSFSDRAPTCYFQNKTEVPMYYSMLYPSGGMMLSLDELSIYLREIALSSEGKGDILDFLNFKKMTSPGDSTGQQMGVFWELWGDDFGHNGGNYGTTCFMRFNRKTEVGMIFMSNISSYRNDKLLKEMVEIWKKINELDLNNE